MFSVSTDAIGCNGYMFLLDRWIMHSVYITLLWYSIVSAACPVLHLQEFCELKVHTHSRGFHIDILSLAIIL